MTAEVHNKTVVPCHSKGVWNTSVSLLLASFGLQRVICMANEALYMAILTSSLKASYDVH